MPFYLGGLVALSGGGDTDVDITMGALLVSSVFGWLFLAGVPWFATTAKGNGPVVDLGLRFRRADLLAFPLGVAMQAVVIPLLYWPLLEVLDRTTDDVSEEARQLTDAARGPGVLLLVLIVCVGAPLAEELFYRGLLLRAVEKRFSLATGAVVATVVFGIAHFQGIQLPALLAFGVVATVLAVRSGRLGPSILCHAGFNAWTVFQLLVIDS